MKTRPVDEMMEFILHAGDVHFQRAPDGQIRLFEGERVLRISTMAMAFPLSRRGKLIVLRDDGGEEIGVLDDIQALDARSRRIVEEEVERSYFLPTILDVLEVSEELRIVSWKVVTDKGPRTFQVRNVRDSLRRLGPRRIVVRDVDGNRYDIPDWTALPLPAQRALDPYL